MIKKIALFLSTISLCAVEHYSIVFVHLGACLPGYLKEALHQARLFNPHAEMYLVTNDVTQQSDADRKVISEDRVHVVHCEQLRMSKSHKDFLQKSTLDTRSKDGFWRKASERFFVLEELIVDYNLHSVFHLESDNMLYVDLETMLDVFKTYPALAAVFDNDERCIPSFIYIHTPVALTELNRFFAKQAHKGLNDMQIPALYKKHFGRTVIDHLPLIPQWYTDKYTLRNEIGTSVKDPSVYWLNYESFNSIFDAAAIGQFLGGTDASNGPKAPGVGFINESCLFNPSYFAYQWIVDEQGRKVPYALLDGKKIRINNLHIHSKALEKFKS